MSKRQLVSISRSCKLISVFGLIIGWFITLFAHDISDNDILFTIWDFLISLQIKAKDKKTKNKSVILEKERNFLYALSMKNNLLKDVSIESETNDSKDESKLAKGDFCEYIVAQIITFYLKGYEVDSKLSDEQMLMMIKNINLNELSMADIKIILKDSLSLIKKHHPDILN